MSVQKVFLGFVPWIVFTLVASRFGPGAVTVACVLALLVAVVLVIRSVTRGESPKVLELTGVVVFLGLAVTAVLDAGADDFLTRYGRAVAALVLAAVIFLLLPVLPFTVQYARESVPREYWHTREFVGVNRRISAAWGAVVAVMALSHAVAGRFEVPEPGVGPLHRPVDLVFNWVVPGLLVWAAARYTQQTAAEAGRDDPQATHTATRRDGT